MSYSRDIIAAAELELSKRKMTAEAEQMRRHNEAVEKIPELMSIEHELALTALDAAKAIGMGDGAGDFVRKLSEKNLALQEKIKELLRDNGLPEDLFEVHYACPDCSDTGYVNGLSCHCRTALIKQLAMKKLSKNSPAGRCRFDNFDLGKYPEAPDSRYGVSPREHMQMIYEFCRCYAEDFDESSESLYLYGATGLGKTHLSLAIAGEVTAAGYNVIYDSASNLLHRLEKEHFSSGKSTEYDGAFDELIGCDLLIIDDLGSEFTTSFTTASIYNIINTRLNRSKPVIISTNLDIQALEERYTERIASRIIGNYQALLFLGKDVRQIIRNSD